MRKQLIVTGKVQGVWYRDWFVGEAKALGLTGWVRNRRDGSVEALVDGAESAVAAIVASAGEGSPASRVDRVDARDAEETERFGGFARRPSG
jgi:acylphosphatase